MALTTNYYSTVKTIYDGFKSNNSIIGAIKITATRSSRSSKDVTISVDARIGFSKSYTDSHDDYKYSVEVKIGSSKYSYEGTFSSLGYNSGVSGNLPDKSNSTAYDVKRVTNSKKVSWYSTDELTVSVNFKQGSATKATSSGTLTMPTYSSSGGGGGEGPITIGKNSMSISISPSSISLGNSATISINSKVGTGNGISKYIIYEGSTELGSTTSTTYTVTPSSVGTKTYKVKAVSKVGTSYDITKSIKFSNCSKC